MRGSFFTSYLPSLQLHLPEIFDNPICYRVCERKDFDITLQREFGIYHEDLRRCSPCLLFLPKLNL